MSTIGLCDDQWVKLPALLRADPRPYVGDETECRRFVD
jgi:hypothetical protein